jgi:SPP1 family predicted phage head-tail adaptor
MPWCDIVYLINLVDEENELGDPIKVLIKNDFIFANKKSVRQSEFYQAAAVGLKPEITFEIHPYEYNGECMLEYNGKTYNVIRTYEVTGEVMELICQGVVNNATT